MKRLLSTILLLVSVSALRAQTFDLLKEINTTATQPGVFSPTFCKVGNTVFFVGSDGLSGAELWKYDVLNFTASLVKDILPGSAGSSPSLMTDMNGILYFQASDGINGPELWRSDGTNAGTYMIKNIAAGNLSATITSLFYFNGTVYFPASNGTSGVELWKTDGTEAGTVMVKDINAGTGSAFSTASPNEFIAMGSFFYFPANNGINGRELWKSDGTEAGTTIVKDIWPGATGSINFQKAAYFNNKIFFSASNGSAVNGTELWATDGTDAGTYMVKDIAAGTANASPNNLIEFNNSLFFSASSANNGTPDLWKTDGTNAGTVMVRNLAADGIGLTVGFNNANNSFTIVGSKMFFFSISGNLGGEICVTDGTTAGTFLIKDIYPGPGSSSPLSLTSFGGKLYFSSQDMTNVPGRRLYVSDGTNAGTYQVTTGDLGAKLSLSGGSLLEANGHLYFAGFTLDESTELWRTDGTSAGTEIAADVNQLKNGTQTSATGLHGSAVLNGVYFFAAADDDHGMELWKSDGTEAGTVMVKDINPGKGNSGPLNFFAEGGFVYFNAGDNIHGSELWKTDGTAAGTVMIKDIWPGPISSTPARFVASNGKVFFTAEDPVNGRETWVTDGTNGGTSLVADITPGITGGNSAGNDFVTVGNYGYHIVSSGRLYKADGFANSFTEFSSDITFANDLGVSGNTLYIIGRNAANQTNLWKSEDGAAPVLIKMISSSATGGSQLTACAGKMYFNASNGTSGAEPWVSDGTNAGTYLIKDISPGSGNSQPFQFVESNGKVYFQASGSGNDLELWATDGTAVGTYLVKDIFPGNTNSSFPSGMIAKPGGQILFIANDGVNGIELWKSNGLASGTTLLQSFNADGDGFVSPVRFTNFSQDYILTKMDGGNSLIFFARSADKGLQLYSGSIASSRYYVNDNNLSDDVYTTAIGSNTNNGSPSSPFATISYAVSQASEGDTIYVDAGTYTEQVTLDKGITIIGAGQGLSSILKPAVTIAPPGSFTEQGVIQTAQNIGNVYISNLSVTGDYTVGVTPIILQCGGSVKDCKLQSGNQGLFVRIDPATNPSTTSFVADGNIIDAEYIAVNLAGTGLNATLTNNTLGAYNPGFSTTVFAGTDFGTLAGLTVTGNTFSSFVSDGLFVNTNNGIISQNSFLGIGAKAINKFGGNTINATCNWYGSALAATVTNKITSGVTYAPWLIDGTDANPVSGFQSSASCSVVNSFYVNDNNTTGDVFTTTVGNNANPGTISAPYATLDYALTQVPPGATIYVDAGTYATPNFTINQSVTILGANYTISPNNSTDKLVANTGRNAESNITGSTFTVSSNDVRIEGLYFDPGTKSQVVLTNGGFNGFLYKRNYSRITSGTFISLTGPTITNTQTPAFGNHLIEDNRFEKTGTTSGIGITAAYLNNVTINNNVFVTPVPATQRVLINAYAGFGGSVTNFNYSNNTSQASNYDLFSFSLVSGIIENNKLLHSQRPLFIQLVAPGSHSVQIRNNHIETDFAINSPIYYGGFDAALAGSTVSAVIEGNTVIQNPTGKNSVQAACRIQMPGTAPNTSLTIKENKFTFNGDYSLFTSSFVTGLNLFGKLQTVNVQDNEIVFSGINLTNTLPVNSPASPGIHISSDGGISSVIPSDAVMNFRGNKISGFRNSIAIYDGLSVAPNTYTGYGNLPLGVTVNINNNSFTGDEFSINNGTTGQAVNATCNWYGSANEDDIKLKVTSATVQHIPWLTNGTDNDVATGFQPVTNSCNGYQHELYVNDGSTTGDVFTATVGDNANPGTAVAPFATVSYAISKAKNGDIIYVDAGIYVENIIINKSVTLRGAKYGQNPGNSLNRGGESIILPSVQTLGLAGTIIQPAANNITIDGLLLDGDNPALTSGSVINGVDVNIGCGIYNNNIVAANLTVKNTIVKNVDAYGIGLFRTLGNQVGPAVVGNLFTQNRVDNIGTRGIVFGYNAFGDILNNYISRCGTSGTWFSQQRVTNVSNNPSIISGNIIENCAVGMQSSSLLTPTSAVHYINNEISNTTAQNPVGISFLVNNASGIVATNNKISGYASGFYINATNAIAPILINNNSITNFTNFAIEVVSTNPVNASCNWYGSAAVQDFYNKLSLDADLAILPWLTNGTDNDAATGFQPVPGVCDGYPTLITLNGSTNVTCNGVANGTVNITTTYGKAPFTYTWTKEGDANFVSHDEDPTGLAAGTYTLSITDGNGANIYLIDPEADGPGTIIVTITEPQVLTANATGTDIPCFGNNVGTVSVEAKGGTAPYTYLWSNGAITSSISNLAAGVYNVTITDANGCIAQSSHQVVQPAAALTVSLTGTSASCNGTATASPSGGTTPYSYLWSNGATTASITNVPAGAYTVTITDDNGCITQGSISLVGNSTINPKATAVNATCFGASNGSITVTSAGGVAPHTYNINGGAFQTSTLFSNLPAGTYIVGAKDANGCSDFVTKVVGQPTQLTVVTDSYRDACFGQNNGAINITASGSAGGYTYAWTGPNGYTSTLRNISNLAAGNYSVVVKDVNNCSTGLSADIAITNEIIVSSTITNVLCRSTATGAVNITVSGGSGSGFTYVWTASNGYTANTEDIANLTAKTYTVTITDIGTGCIVTRSYPVTEPALLNLSVSSANAIDCDLGTITATASGGAGGYEYQLNNGGYQSSGIFTGVAAGTYTIWLKDLNGCIKSASATITDNGKDVYESNNSKNKAAEIAVFTTVSGRIALATDAADWFKFTTPNTSGIYTLVFNPNSTATFTYDMYAAGNGPALTPVAGMTTPVSKSYNLAANTVYYISVTGGLSYTCYQLVVTQAAQSRIVQPLYTDKGKPVDPVSGKLNATAFPNPHQGNFMLQVEAPQDGQGSVQLLGADGKTISTQNVVLRKGKNNTIQFANMRHAVLFYRVILGKQEATGKVIGQY